MRDLLSLQYTDLISNPVSQRKREFGSKVGQMLKASFGDQIAGMLEIRGLATAPDKRRRGYATILMRLAHEMVGRLPYSSVIPRG